MTSAAIRSGTRLDFGDAQMITPIDGAGPDDPAPVLRTSFYLPEAPRSAVIDITAWGVYEARINGILIDDALLDPGWTAYQSRLLAKSVDVSSLVRAGRNAIEVTLGNGWYRGNLGRPARRDLYGSRLGLLAQLRATLPDGKDVHVVTNPNDWRAAPTGIVENDLYNGSELHIGATPGDGDWGAVEALSFDRSVLADRLAEPVRAIRRVASLHMERDGNDPAGRILVDFGENVVGWVEITLARPTAGQTLIVRHAEVLEQDGSLATRPLRQARATDRYVLADGVRVVLAPPFTFHGFRYAEIEGILPNQQVELTAVVIASDLRQTGSFSVSHPLLDTLHANILRSLRGNFVSLPTDCPQRDERLGWTADIQVFAATAAFLVDCREFLASWLADLRAEQKEDGSVPNIVPDIYRRASAAAAGWGDAATIVPWELYQRFGDTAILTEAFESMRGWVDHVTSLAGPERIWSGGYQYGDWLDPSAPPDDPAAAVTDPDLVATAYFYRSADILARSAAVLGNGALARSYGELAEEVHAAFNRRFTSSAGRLTSDTQSAYALAIRFGLVREGPRRIIAGRRLADLVRRADFTLSTGFLGTPVLLDALTDTGNDAVAMRLLLQTSAPSWLYPVTMGATTIWERWDSMLPDGSVNPGEMTSFNHYAFGAVADWMHRYLGGLSPISPGYRRFAVRPPRCTGLGSVRTTLDLDAGTIDVHWQEDTTGQLVLSLAVPHKTTAEVWLPGASDPLVVGAGDHKWLVGPEPGGGDEYSIPVTTREAIDDPGLWDQIVAAVLSLRPEWTPALVAKKAERYFDLDVRSLARIVGLSVELPAEVTLRESIADAVSARRETQLAPSAASWQLPR